jgi:hypothetical protein
LAKAIGTSAGKIDSDADTARARRMNDAITWISNRERGRTRRRRDQSPRL